MITNSVLNQNALSKSTYQLAKASQNELVKENLAPVRSEKTTAFVKEPNKGNMVDFTS